MAPDLDLHSLEAASAEAQKRYTQPVLASGGNEELRQQQLDQAIAVGDGAEAQALLWAQLSPSSSTLVALQWEQQARCQITPY